MSRSLLTSPALFGSSATKATAKPVTATGAYASGAPELVAGSDTKAAAAPPVSSSRRADGSDMRLWRNLKRSARRQ